MTKNVTCKSYGRYDGLLIDRLASLIGNDCVNPSTHSYIGKSFEKFIQELISKSTINS